jgi:polyphosphate kinase
MAKKDLLKPAYYINRELSWLEFNQRVLQEGLDESVPLMERIRFLAIVSSNLDEFFMIRVAGLMQRRAAGLRRRDPSGMTPNQQLQAVSWRAHRMVADQAAGIRQALDELGRNGLREIGRRDWTPGQRQFLYKHFRDDLLPVLTPLGIQDLDPCPLLQPLQLNVAVRLELAADADPQINRWLIEWTGVRTSLQRLPLSSGHRAVNYTY